MTRWNKFDETKTKFRTSSIQTTDNSTNVNLPLGIKNETKLNQKIEKLVECDLNMLVVDGETKEFTHIPNELEHVS